MAQLISDDDLDEFERQTHDALKVIALARIGKSVVNYSQSQLERFARALDAARYAVDFPEHLRRGVFDQDKHGRDYAFRLTRALLDEIAKEGE